MDNSLINIGTIKGSQLLRPLFEFSGACAGCGETPTSSWPPNCSATGCSSPMPPDVPRFTAATCRPPRTAKRADGRGPAWSNSLFEDNAEYGLGMRQAVNKLASQAAELLERGSEEAG
jgi:pyruvate-ferredoxin/flavodoxin oxidoreductase